MHRESQRKAIAAAQDRQTTQYNKTRRDIPELDEGSQVPVNPHSLKWVDAKRAGTKLKQPWIGPFKVMQKISPKVIHLCMSDKHLGLPVFNIEHLKLYHVSDTTWGECTTMKESQCLKTLSEGYSVEAIVGHHGKKHGMEWLVCWEGYGPQFDTWKPTSYLRNAPLVLNEYKQVHGL